MDLPIVVVAISVVLILVMIFGVLLLNKTGKAVSRRKARPARRLWEKELPLV
jgi:hypothetical protein